MSGHSGARLRWSQEAFGAGDVAAPVILASIRQVSPRRAFMGGAEVSQAEPHGISRCEVLRAEVKQSETVHEFSC